MHTDATRVAVLGATGYAGQELIRRLARHPSASLDVAMASAAAETPRRVPSFDRLWRGEVVPLATGGLAGKIDAAFLSLPEAVSAQVAPVLVEAGIRVFDLSGAFRLRDASTRERWYPHTPAAWPAGTAYGLTEHHRDTVREAALVACPGCYPTAALLALAPLSARGLLEGDVVIDAKSGLSGAGRAPSERTHFSENHGSVAAYGVFAHRHVAEMEQELGRQVTFVPHLVPLDRGILETIYVRVRAGTCAADVSAAFEAAYRNEPFVRLVGDRLPEIKHVVHTNFCDIGWVLDAESRRLVVVSCLDNLVKGAAGQAIQNFNVAFGIDEIAGLW